MKRFKSLVLVVLLSILIVGCQNISSTTTTKKNTTTTQLTSVPYSTTKTTTTTTKTVTTIKPTTTFCIGACNVTESTIGENEAILPDLTGMSRKEIISTLTELGIEYNLRFVRDYYKESQYDKFLYYGSSYQAGDTFNTSRKITVYTTVLPLTEVFTDQIMLLESKYQNKVFTEDGIGVVTLVRTIDGDTARFRDSSGVEFTVRFLGVDTPESTLTVDPFGKEASSFTSNRLRNAKLIVLESETNSVSHDTYGRYLAYVWVDGICLNLELIQEAYSNCTASESTKYGTVFQDASLAAARTGRRFFGWELDPNFVYKD